ncbi:MAG: inositol 2-dehydrogenase [Candidatus Lokiarchaeota archaeon]|nr:inositol 2-dehydrogenase [Candidatus Lokiarchaeota archaeon]
MKKNIPIGIIGAGRIGKLHISNILQNIPDFSIEIVADIAIDSLKKWAELHRIKKITDNPQDVFDNPDVKAVLICSSTDTHAEFIEKAANAGKDIFCEKPIDPDVKVIKNVLDTVEENKVKLQIGFNRRFDHNFKRVRNLVASGEIGDPHIVKITSRDPAPPPIDYIKVSGGLFNDMTIHDWDMARYLGGSQTGEVTEVYAMGGVLVDEKIGSEGNDIDTCAVVLRYENGGMAMIDNSRQAVYGYDQRVEVFGSKGVAIAENDRPNNVKFYNEKDISMDKIPYFFLERYMQSYTDEIVSFYECLREDKQPVVDGKDGLMAVVVAKAAMKSLCENRPVKITEIQFGF